MADFTSGDHLKVSRGVYAHHGIYVGDGVVIHYSGEVFQKSEATIRRDPLERFVGGGTAEVVAYAASNDCEEVVRRAVSRLGENGYSLFGNNCEHFARWCKTGEHASDQVHDVAAGTAGVSSLVWRPRVGSGSYPPGEQRRVSAEPGSCPGLRPQVRSSDRALSPAL